MFTNPRRGRQARNFTKNVPKILDLKSSSEQILTLGAPVCADSIKVMAPNSQLMNGKSFNTSLINFENTHGF